MFWLCVNFYDIVEQGAMALGVWCLTFRDKVVSTSRVA
jgi:hypothetical protein